MEACKQYYKTQYVRLPDLLMELDLTQQSASFQKVLAKYDALTAHVSLAFIRYMLLSLQQRNNSDERTISELFLLMIDELADITFGHALQLIVDIMLQIIQERFGLSDEQLLNRIRSLVLIEFQGPKAISYVGSLRY